MLFMTFVVIVATVSVVVFDPIVPRLFAFFLRGCIQFMRRGVVAPCLFMVCIVAVISLVVMLFIGQAIPVDAVPFAVRHAFGVGGDIFVDAAHQVPLCDRLVWII